MPTRLHLNTHTELPERLAMPILPIGSHSLPDLMKGKPPNQPGENTLPSQPTSPVVQQTTSIAILSSGGLEKYRASLLCVDLLDYLEQGQKILEDRGLTQ